MHRAAIMAAIEAERERQFNLPGSETDLRRSPNEWAAIIGHYVFDEVMRGNTPPDRVEYEINLVKAAAVIVAALESVPAMQAFGHFQGGAPDALTNLVTALKQVQNPKP